MQEPTVPVLRRPTPPKTVISLVPMIDVMLILLVFFMVTSTYLNLDMIPAVAQEDSSAEPPSASSEGRTSPPLLVRLGADGVPTVQGRALSPSDFERLVGDRVAENPMARILVLPSGAADMQALISVMDAATRSGATNVSIVRLEASQ